MNLTYVAFDVAVAAIAVRSLTVLGTHARWLSAGWAATVVSAGAAAIRYSQPGPQPVPMFVAEAFFAVLTVCFVVGAVRDEPQAEPLLWPQRIGATRAQKR